MRVLIFEPYSQGHFLQFARALVDAFLPLAAELHLALGDSAPASAEFDTHLAPIVDRLTSLDTSAKSLGGRTIRAARQKLDDLNRLIAHFCPDQVWIPYADWLAQVSGALRLVGLAARPPDGVELEALLLRGQFGYGRSGMMHALKTAGWIATTSLSRFDCIHHLDPIQYEHILRRGGSLAQRSRLIPEPVESFQPLDRISARRMLGVPEDGRYVGCAGAFGMRKGTHMLLCAFAMATLAPTDRLLLVGKTEPAIRAMLDNEFAALVRAGRIVALDRCVSQDEFAAGLCAMDLVTAPYPKHIGSSGIVVRAAAARRPLLGSSFGWIGMVIPRFGLGTVCDVSDIPGFASSISRELDRAADHEPSDAALRFTQFHSQINFAAHATARLRQRISHPPSEHLRTWDWVLQGRL